MRARRHKEEHENHERWLVSYADFITLLFAFFVVLYATSSQNEEKEKKFENAIRSKFHLVGGAGEGQGDGGAFAPVLSPVEIMQRKNIGNGELSDAIDRLLQENMNKEELKTSVTGLRHDQSGVRITLSASTFFPSGSSKLRLPALRSLDKIAEILKKSNRTIVVEGHTDDKAVVGGTLESNWELASLRATSVVRYLIKYHQIDGQKISAASFADQRPLVPNNSEENRARNRRIEILILN